jgi:hypothetical protein
MNPLPSWEEWAPSGNEALRIQTMLIERVLRLLEGYFHFQILGLTFWLPYTE